MATIAIGRFARYAVPITLLVLTVSPVVPVRADEPATANGVNWDELVHEYLALGLPAPPENAPLVAMFHDMEVVDDIYDNEGRPIPLNQPRYLLGFLIANDEDKSSKLLVGTEWFDLAIVRATDLIRINSVEKLPHSVVEGNKDGTFEINAALPLAVQCYRRGFKDMAELLLRLSQTRSYGHSASPFHQPHGLSPLVALRYVAWTHWGNQLVEAGTDRAAAHRRMTELIRREPALRTAARLELLDALQAALQPRCAALGSAERLVDDLVDDQSLYFGSRPALEDPPSVAALARLGWEAMPVLLQHLQDRRLTRCLNRPWDGSPHYILSVGQIVGGLVQEFAGDEGLQWKRTSDGRFLLTEPVLAWWERVQTQNEEDYLLQAAIPRAPQASRPYDAIISRLAAAYPQRLPDVYRRMLAERPEMPTWSIGLALVHADLDPTVKSDTLAAGVGHKNLAREVEALEMLSGIDTPRFEALLLESLAKFPVGTEGQFAYCPQVDLARLCLKTDRPAVWAALRNAAVKADVGVRMEMIGRFGDRSSLTPANLHRVAGFLAAFLDDQTVRDMSVAPNQYDGCEARWWPEIEVRNWAAYRLGMLLEMDVSACAPGEPISEKQWEELRGQVAKRWAEVDKAAPN